ncbi:follicle-stimulating hormone receptor-like isoform X2 [Mya arenaria]|uniref:follicle-stimulating hormone receptor-like isoform X2 n=1 Tax=Mya arenaria TaxID=6604 RepID=UPI0022E98C39|nr:follicle-stimulating hormone receptor-like isoform X2 [Mya arenaria]
MGDQTLALGRIFTRTTRTLVYIVVILVSCVFVRCGSSYQCPSMCQCEHAKTGMLVDCTGKNLSAVPPGLGPNTIKLGLSMNNITELPDRSFAHLPRLQSLMLSHNRIRTIAPAAFEGLSVLYLLEISNNLLTEIPQGLDALPDLSDLAITDNRIKVLPNDCFSKNRKLIFLKLKDNPIVSVGQNTFSNMPDLKDLVLSEVREMQEFPNLSGTTGLEKITLDRASISVLPEDLCQNLPHLAVFDVHSNFISVIPNMTGCSSLTLLNFGNNEIASLDKMPFQGLENLKDLILSYNKITHISASDFASLKRLQYLDLSYNKISFINQDAFANLKQLMDLNLGENTFPSLPTAGLENLRHLKTFHNRYLQEPPSKEALPNILTMVVAYAYHCCAFRSQAEQTGEFKLDQTVTWLNDPNVTSLDLWPDVGNISYLPMNFSIYYDEYDYDYNDTIDGEASYPIETIIKIKPPVECSPVPDPFQPCDDLFGWWSLRCGVWIVFLLAVLGNGSVLFVSVFSKSKLDVTRFLICNLALSDLCMGMYLGFLAIVDASTLGEFEKYATRWQSSPGCLVAGFLGVLSSELSVFTLVVITVERFYAISHAMQLGKRVRLGQACVVMICGWILCTCIASLPLFEISDYRKFAICLPFETENNVSLAYVCFIMIFNASSFLIILVCYGCMFVSIRASHSWNSKDTIVAKRMALLVFTDFFCWAPIIFCSITAAFGWEAARISLDEAKVLTIFVLPLNSCANPFLYAFFTRQFKRDCVKLCKRIEESSYSRHLPSSGVGRSSTANNRQPNGRRSHSKRGSCDQLVYEPSTSGEPSTSSNQASDDSDLTMRKIHLTSEEKQILRYVKSAEGTSPRRSLLLPKNRSFERQHGGSYNLVPIKRSRVVPPHITPEDDESESSPDIILHTKEGNVYLSTKLDTQKVLRRKGRGSVKSLTGKGAVNKCAQRLCNHTRNSGYALQSVRNLGRSVESQTVETCEKEIHADLETLHEDANSKVSENGVRKLFEAERSKEIGLKSKCFANINKPEPRITENKVARVTTSSQTDFQLPSSHFYNIQKAIAKKEKDKHINEWRKTSHLSFLWRNSGIFDGVTHKQKSNSLVELTRPFLDAQNTSNKRHSLTSKHEGYILLKNTSRDSAYEDDELYDIYDNRGNGITQSDQSAVKQQKVKDYKNSAIKDSEDGDKTNDEKDDQVCEASLLLTDNLCLPKHRNSCDIESGISSSS